MRLLAFAIILPLLATSCAFTPHEVAVTAKAPATPSDIGKGTTIALETLDDRETLVVGQRGVGMQGADITARQVMTALKTQLETGFRAKGFDVTDQSDGQRPEVEARLRSFKFFIESGFFTGAENVDTAIAIEARKNGKRFHQIYRSSSENRTLVVPGGATIDQKLNASLTDVLQQIFADNTLMRFLVD
ncbi:MAG: hypothetical protein KDC18_15335 [Alphaproteobacteria bacterium]|nr:hypothetical protein [Alphaproteobacteria bacterium]MCB9931509.1 hypothetical protein [Alphaproteobacteria bacterium]